MKIRFHNSIIWQYKLITQSLQKQDYKWNVDMWGLKPPHDAIHLHFKNQKVYNAALDIQNKLNEQI